MVLIVVSSSQFMPADFIQFHSRNPISTAQPTYFPEQLLPKSPFMTKCKKKTMILHLFLFAHNQGGCLMETARDLSTEPEILQAIPCETGFVCWRPWLVPA